MLDNIICGLLNPFVMTRTGRNRLAMVVLIALSTCPSANGAVGARIAQSAQHVNKAETQIQRHEPAAIVKELDAKPGIQGDPQMYDEDRIEEWLEKYKQAWENQDAELVATLFTENARYAVNPLENVLNTRQAIKAYWSAGAAGAQKDIKFDHELWSAANEMVIVHWTASFVRAATEERVNMDGVFRLGFVHGEGGGLVCSLLEEWWFLAADLQSRDVPVKTAPFSLKTKISTPRYDETIDYYKGAFGMALAEAWDKPDDRGAILVFDNGRDEALFEIYYSDEIHDFSGLSLQFRVRDLNAFLEKLPGQYEYEGPKPRPWGATYLYLRDPNGILIIVYEGGM